MISFQAPLAGTHWEAPPPRTKDQGFGVTHMVVMVGEPRFTARAWPPINPLPAVKTPCRRRRPNHGGWLIGHLPTDGPVASALPLESTRHDAEDSSFHLLAMAYIDVSPYITHHLPLDPRVDAQWPVHSSTPCREIRLVGLVAHPSQACNLQAAPCHRRHQDPRWTPKLHRQIPPPPHIDTHSPTQSKFCFLAANPSSWFQHSLGRMV